MIVLWGALVVTLTAATYSVTWDLCTANNNDEEFDAWPIKAGWLDGCPSMLAAAFLLGYIFPL